MARSFVSRTLLLVALGAVLAGCSTASDGSSQGSSSPTASPSASSTSPYGTLTIDPAGPDDPVLEVDGGSSGHQSFTMVQLEALGTTTITVDEPFVKKRQSFTGVPLSTILTKAGIAGGVRITTHALNDYDYANVASAFTGSEAIVATQRDAARIPLDQGGPIRLVYPDGTPMSGVLDAWNWSLASIATGSGDGT
ncbi:MAG: molybdopterin-dependent oxidoreductase [Candidatus Nanopelagicales bacterium]